MKSVSKVWKINEGIIVSTKKTDKSTELINRIKQADKTIRLQHGNVIPQLIRSWVTKRVKIHMAKEGIRIQAHRKTRPENNRSGENNQQGQYAI